jgi:anti-sigma factor RsiW
MHEPIRDNLEEYLRTSAGRIPQEFQAHLEACEECAKEVRMLETQSRMLRALQVGESAEPRAGFYARVMERIEEHGPSSIWSILLQPRIGRRLAVASAALALLLAGYLVSSELAYPGIASAPSVVARDASATLVPGSEVAAPAAAPDDAQQQRDALLVNLASFRQ